jgi:DNA polymerase III epsilon subunit-like protein
MKLLFIDTETTGTGPNDRLIQVAYRYRDENEKVKTVNELFKPPLPVKLMAMAVHHIRNQDLEGKPVFVGSDTYLELKVLAEQGYIFVAHNAKFDLAMLAKEGIVFNDYIDTLKIARAADPAAVCESYSMQYLRYFYDLDVDLGGLAPHDALADIIVLRALFQTLMDYIPQADMVQISKEPALLTKMTFGKYAKQGITSLEKIAQLDKDYLRWLLNDKLEAPEGEEDWIYSLRYYINQ